ncbi:GntR family transcriptional regulator [Pseudorhodoferax soli]|uniref:GntR family transcriptional regulator n=1 Tax=Pseudorhodoferax soli TaxID=545864 RepID=A0A368XNI2_9BURK|nr:GntR family transcriptional regulator [Pseudorhodoferax soli]RCW69523.1 GntR family transcriptional regulator [Pseudorhodoferax soli]
MPNAVSASRLTSIGDKTDTNPTRIRFTPERKSAKNQNSMTAAPSIRLSKATGTALHRQLFLVLREQIMRGVYEAGALLPTEEELCKLFGVSSITVRRALGDLKSEGLVERFQGRGTFVSQQLPKSQFEAANFLEALKRQGQETKVKVLEVRIAVPPAHVALQMQFSSGAEAFFAARLRHVNNQPMMVTEAWVPLPLAKEVTAKLLHQKPLYEILMSKGVEFSRVIEEITAVAASPSHAEHLGTGIGVPLLRMTRLMYDKDNHPVELLTVYMNPERSRVLLNVPPLEAQRGVAGRIVHT